MGVSKLSPTSQSHANNVPGNPSVKGRFSKFMHQHKTPLIVSCTAVALLTLGGVANTWQTKQPEGKYEGTHEDQSDLALLLRTLAKDSGKAPFHREHDEIDKLIFARPGLTNPPNFSNKPRATEDYSAYIDMNKSCREIAKSIGIDQSNIDWSEVVISDDNSDELIKLSCYINTYKCNSKDFLALYSANTLQADTQNIYFHDDQCSGWGRISVDKDKFSKLLREMLPVHFAHLTTSGSPNQVDIKLALNM